MSALTGDRNTPRRDGAHFSDPVAADTRLFAGGMYLLDGSGNAIPAGTDVYKVRAVARRQADNTDGAAGDLQVEGETGVFRFINDDAAPVTRGHIGRLVYAVDDQTVSSLNGMDQRGTAGLCVDVDDQGVWVAIGRLEGTNASGGG